MSSKKNILITGVSRGVGLSIASGMLSQGWQVYGISRTLTPGVQQLMDGHPDSFHFLAFDVSDLGSLPQQVFKSFVPNAVPLHALVNNAAIAYDDIVTNLQEEKLHQMFKVNVYAPMMLTKYAIRNMIFNRVQGSIVHISSVSVHTGYKGLAMYAASKGALEAFSLNTAREWGERGIRSNCVVAGFMDTDMSAGLTAEQKDRIYKRTSLKRPVDLMEVANVVGFLAGEGSSAVTGSNIFADNGTV